MKQLILDIGLGVESTLNSFAPGENEAVLAHLRLWVGSPTRSPVPTYLWGGSGSGKTHLLKAVRHALTDRGVRVGWLDATASDAGEFDDSWGAVLMDDVDRLDSTGQQVAFNWFVNALSPSSGEARWVLACGAMPPACLAVRDGCSGVARGSSFPAGLGPCFPVASPFGVGASGGIAKSRRCPRDISCGRGY